MLICEQYSEHLSARLNRALWFKVPALSLSVESRISINGCRMYAVYFLFCEEHSSRHFDCWPLDLKLKSTIMKNYSEIARRLITDENLICQLLSRECFAVHLLINIENTHDDRERNKKLLNCLLRSSTATFKQFVECLQTTQRHLLPLFTGHSGKMHSVFHQATSNCIQATWLWPAAGWKWTISRACSSVKQLNYELLNNKFQRITTCLPPLF